MTIKSAQAGVDLFERGGAGAKFFFVERVERRRDRAEMRVQVFGLGVYVKQSGHDLALGGMDIQKRHGADAVVSVVIGGDLLERELRAVVLLDDLDGAGFVGDLDRRARGDEVEEIHRFVVLAHVIETLGRSGVVVEGNARRNHIDEGRAFVIGTSCALSPEKLRATKVAPSCNAIAARSIEESLLVTPRFDLEPRSAV